jgi:hypothetical protein
MCDCLIPSTQQLVTFVFIIWQKFAISFDHLQAFYQIWKVETRNCVVLVIEIINFAGVFLVHFACHIPLLLMLIECGKLYIWVCVLKYSR